MGYAHANKERSRTYLPDRTSVPPAVLVGKGSRSHGLSTVSGPHKTFRHFGMPLSRNPKLVSEASSTSGTTIRLPLCSILAAANPQHLVHSRKRSGEIGQKIAQCGAAAEGGRTDLLTMCATPSLVTRSHLKISVPFAVLYMRVALLGPSHEARKSGEYPAPLSAGSRIGMGDLSQRKCII